jgi:hypothetical protein
MKMAMSERTRLCIDACERLTDQELKNVIDGDGFHSMAADLIVERDNLVVALEDLIAAFCPGPDWSTIPVREEADKAINSAKNGMQGGPNVICTP